MRILISADYLLASAFCAQSDIFHYYNGLSRLKSEYDAGFPVFLEPDALLKLQDKGLYPSLDLFKKNFPKQHEWSFGAEQITKLVAYLLGNVAPLDVDKDIVADWQELELESDPDLHADAERDEHLAQLMVDLSLENAGFGHEHIVFHHQMPKIPSSATVMGVISGVTPDLFPVPKSVNHTIPISDNLIDYILSTDALAGYQKSTSDSDMKRAIFFGAIQFLLKNGGDPTSINEHCFCLGADFRASVLNNECGGGGAFSSTLFENMIRIVAGAPKNKINKFYTYEGSGEQLTKGGRLAWRTHVTEGARALRLMFWTHSNGLIELANVGNKWECEIA